ncbi:MAG: hypothetical protein ACLFQX_05620 [Candidatus Kapaibacterium sp.]
MDSPLRIPSLEKVSNRSKKVSLMIGLFAILTMTLLSSANVFAQQKGTVKGTVINRETGAPLKSATVQIPASSHLFNLINLLEV